MSDVTEEKNVAEALTQNRARQRKNQQNSRKRKQSYLEDLEQRWASCVRTGAQTSTEMQREARRVDGENVMLRAMLRELGVPNAVIEARLVGAEHLPDGRVANMVVNPCAPVPAVEPDALMTLARNHGVRSGTKRSQHSQSTLADGSDIALAAQKLPDASHSAATNMLPDFDTWLHDLADIKDAFGVEARQGLESMDSGPGGDDLLEPIDPLLLLLQD